MSTLEPGPEWVGVPPEAVLPAGCEVQMDMSSDRQRARRAPAADGSRQNSDAAKDVPRLADRDEISRFVDALSDTRPRALTSPWTASTILGDYSAVAPGDLLLVTQSDQHPCDNGNAQRSAPGDCAGVSAGAGWDEPKLKSLTGGDPITARFMRQDFFTYEPQFTLWVAGNHKPSFRGVDEAIRRRVLLVPFLE